MPYAGNEMQVGRRARPSFDAADEALVHDFCIELHRKQRVCDATYAAALARFARSAWSTGLL